jgi:hypothetical protein
MGAAAALKLASAHPSATISSILNSCYTTYLEDLGNIFRSLQLPIPEPISEPFPDSLLEPIPQPPTSVPPLPTPPPRSVQKEKKEKKERVRESSDDDGVGVGVGDDGVGDDDVGDDDDDGYYDYFYNSKMDKSRIL